MGRDELRERISDGLDAVLHDIYENLGIKKGDIEPLQALEWDEICDRAAALFEELIALNEV